METKRNTLFQALFLLITEQLLFFPASFILFRWFNTDRIVAVYYFMGLYLSIFYYIYTKYTTVKSAYRVLPAIACLILFGLYHSQLGWSAVPIILWGLFILYRILSSADSMSVNLNFFASVVLGAFFYLISAVYFNYSRIFQPSLGLLGILATITVICAYYGMNMTHISYTRTIGSKIVRIPVQSKKSNRFLMTLFVLITLLVTGIEYLNTIGSFLMSVLINIIKTLFSWLTWFSSGSEPQTVEQATPPPLEYEESSASPFWEIVQAILFYAVLIAVLLLFVLALYRMVKHLIKNHQEILQKISQRINRLLRYLFRNPENTDPVDFGYEDEETSLLNKNETFLGAARKWFKKRPAVRPYRYMKDNTQKARWLYVNLVRTGIKKGVALSRTMTPQQILEQMSPLPHDKKEITDAVSCYHLARYGETLPDENSLSALKNYSSKSSRV